MRPSGSLPVVRSESTHWRTSTFSQEGQCVELARWTSPWLNASDGGGSCVELAVAASTGDASDVLGVRDSKAPADGELYLPDVARGALLSFVRTNY